MNYMKIATEFERLQYVSHCVKWLERSVMAEAVTPSYREQADS